MEGELLNYAPLSDNIIRDVPKLYATLCIETVATDSLLSSDISNVITKPVNCSIMVNKYLYQLTVGVYLPMRSVLILLNRLAA